MTHNVFKVLFAFLYIIIIIIIIISHAIVIVKHCIELHAMLYVNKNIFPISARCQYIIYNTFNKIFL